MSIAVPQQISVGLRNPSAVYIQIKNGNVYRFNKDVPQSKTGAFMNKVMFLGKANLKHWNRVR